MDLVKQFKMICNINAGVELMYKVLQNLLNNSNAVLNGKSVSTFKALNTITDEIVLFELCVDIADGNETGRVYTSVTDNVSFSTLSGLLSSNYILDVSDDTIQVGGTEELVVNATMQQLPTLFPPQTQHVFIDVDNMSTDLDLSSYSPTGLIDQALVRVRKIDSSANVITFNDGSVNYNFVNRRSEFMTLKWNSSTSTFNII